MRSLDGHSYKVLLQTFICIQLRKLEYSITHSPVIVKTVEGHRGARAYPSSLLLEAAGYTLAD